MAPISLVGGLAQELVETRHRNLVEFNAIALAHVLVSYL